MSKLILDMQELCKSFPGKIVVPLYSTSVLESAYFVGAILRYKEGLELEYDIKTLELSKNLTNLHWQTVALISLTGARISGDFEYEYTPVINEYANKVVNNLGYDIKFIFGRSIVTELSSGLEVHPYLLSEDIKTKLLMVMLLRNNVIGSNTVIYSTNVMKPYIEEFMNGLSVDLKVSIVYAN